MKTFSKLIKKAMQDELEDVMKLKENIVLEKAKLTAIKGTYEVALKQIDINSKRNMVDRSIDNQESLNKFEDYQIAQLIEQNSQHIWDIINADENADFAKFTNNAKTVANDHSFTARNTYFDDIRRKKSKNKKKQNVNNLDSKFEYCIEEDDLSYNSSLHSARFK